MLKVLGCFLSFSTMKSMTCGTGNKAPVEQTFNGETHQWVQLFMEMIDESGGRVKKLSS